MTYLEWARDLDREERIVEAAWAYEIATREEDTGLDASLDLVALYLSAQDLGFASRHRLSPQWSAAAARRGVEVLDAAEQRLGKLGEIDAWRLYLRERVAYEDIPDHAYEEVAVRTSALMAYFRLYIASGGLRYREEVKPLFELVRQPLTERQRYLSSVLHSFALAEPPAR